jgi:putative RNA 2'-phosphotransferase
MLSQYQKVRLSKFLSLILRHQASQFGLPLDPQGFVPLADLLAAIRQQRGWQGMTASDIEDVVSCSDKQRFEISTGNIRAHYGHSIAQRITYPAVEPPEVLYHGTSPMSLPALRKEGLQPGNRQYIHLSTSWDEARQVGQRHHSRPVVLTVQARAAWQKGVSFFQPQERLYLSDAIPAQFIQ